MDNPTTSKNENVISELKKPTVLYPIMFMILFLTIVMFLIFFKVKLPGTGPTKSQQEVIADVFIVLFFCLIIFGICVALLPNFKEVRKLFEQISSVTYVIIYTIFLILFFTMTPSDTINNYSFAITFLTIGLGCLMFYKSLSNNYITEFNANYERIKMLILFFCLITIFIIYYNTDPGGYIEKYFGYSLLLTIIISVFAFLYLIIVLTLPDDSKRAKPGNILDSFSKVSSYGSIAFLVFIAIMTILISTYPGGFFNDKTTSAGVMILLLMICIISAIVLGANTFPEIFNNTPLNDKTNLFKRSLLALFGIVISSLVIFWLVYGIQNLSGKTGTTSFILNILLVVVVLGLIYKTLNVNLPEGNSNKNAFFSLITNTLFYIPCLFSGLFDYIGKVTTGGVNSEATGSLLMLILALVLIVAYFKMPSVFNILNSQGGEQLVNKPVYTDTKYALGSYQELNGSDNPDYQYAISCWVFVDAAPPNTSSSYSKFTSLLNFANKPNVLYNGTTNTLMITTDQKNLKEVTKNKLIDFNENGNRIIYKNSDFLLQKWNNIIINYNGGVLDIFLNGELVKSDIGVVPYMIYDNLTIGEDDGIKGGICNVIYFKRPLNSSNIFYLYNMVKDRSPPVLNESNTTIVKQDINEVVTSTNTII
jgi:hypothetical protein